MSTPQLGISHITANQSNKETTANTAFDALDNAMNAILDVTINTTSRILTSAEFKACQIIRATGNPAASLTLAVAPNVPKLFSVYNNTTKTLFIECQSARSTGESLIAGAAGIFYSDGDEVYKLGEATPTGVTSLDLGMFIQGIPGSNELVFRFVCVSAFQLPANCSGSRGNARVAATGTLRFMLMKNTTPFGYIQFGASSTSTFVSSETSFAAGDVLSIFADEYGDVDTLSDVSITLKGTRL